MPRLNLSGVRRAQPVAVQQRRGALGLESGGSGQRGGGGPLGGGDGCCPHEMFDLPLTAGGLLRLHPGGLRHRPRRRIFEDQQLGPGIHRSSDFASEVDHGPPDFRRQRRTRPWLRPGGVSAAALHCLALDGDNERLRRRQVRPFFRQLALNRSLSKEASDGKEHDRGQESKGKAANDRTFVAPGKHGPLPSESRHERKEAPYVRAAAPSHARRQLVAGSAMRDRVVTPRWQSGVNCRTSIIIPCANAGCCCAIRVASSRARTSKVT